MILKTPHLNQQEYNKVMIWKIDQMSSSLSFQRASLELLLRRTPHTQTNQTLAGGFFSGTNDPLFTSNSRSDRSAVWR